MQLILSTAIQSKPAWLVVFSWPCVLAMEGLTVCNRFTGPSRDKSVSCFCVVFWFFGKQSSTMARRASTSSLPARGLKKWLKKPLRQKLAQAAIAVGAAGMLAGALLAGYAFLIVEPNLPALDTLIDYRPKIPLRVYTADNVLIGEFGDERRDFVPIAQMPPAMKNALIAIEDSYFYQHGGVDYTGIARAALANLRNSKSQG